MMREPKLFAVANWKMNFTVSDALKFLTVFLKQLPTPPENVEVIFAPSFLSLYPLAGELEETFYKLAAQNIHWEETGNFTGETSARDLKEQGIHYVILGHSERRHLFSETDDQIEKKLIAAITSGLRPILCIGETQKERETGVTFSVLERQLLKTLQDKREDQLDGLLVAYEPVWAIGTGQTASPSQAEEVHQWIREWLIKHFDSPLARSIPLLYGGSVESDKARGLVSQADIDGLLVGGASLDPKKFADIIHLIAQKEFS